MTINRREFIGAGLAIMGAGLAGCAGSGGSSDWVTLVDGKSIPSGWKELGKGNWSVAEGALQGKDGNAGFLVSPESYADFEIRAEFWGDAEANSGIFIRAQDPNKIGADTSYEVNIWDKRPDPSYGTGGIVNFAAVATPYPKSANRWNVYEVRALGDRVTVWLNGQQTADMTRAKFLKGPIALQSAAGTIRFRKVEIRSL
ncbi:MAG: DUF1080 domain-containing protein [Betaproteobacteria bacterium]